MKNSRTQQTIVLSLVLLVSVSTTVRLCAQLDSGWTVQGGSQTVQVEPDGSFRILNISAADEFGRAGPGSPPDFFSDQPIRVVGVAVINGETLWAYSAPFHLQSGTTSRVGALTVTSEAPPFPVSLALDAPRRDFVVGESASLSVTGTLADDSELNLSSFEDGTIYRTSNPSIATVYSNGTFVARAPGSVIISAVNEGLTTAIELDVVERVFSVEVEGLVESPDGAPLEGAELLVDDVVRATSAADGFFSFTFDRAVAGESIEVVARTELNGRELVATRLVDPTPDRIADAGILRLRNDQLFLDPEFLPVEGGTNVEALRSSSADRLDLLVLSLFSDTLTMLVETDGEYQETQVVVFERAPSIMALTDLDQDGDEDVIVLGDEFNFRERIYASSLFVLENLGDGSLGEPLERDLGRLADDFVVLDVNGGGSEIVVNFPGAFAQQAGIEWLGTDGELTLGETNPISMGSADLVSLATGDANGDGIRDLVVVESDFEGGIDGGEGGEPPMPSLKIFPNGGDGSFGEPTIVQLALPLQFFRIALDDFTGDDLSDFVIPGVDGEFKRPLIASAVAVVPGTAPLSFGEPEIIPTTEPGYPFDFALGDVDGDQRLDAVTLFDDDESIVFLGVLFGAGKEGLQGLREIPLSQQATDLTLRDIDGDGDADAVIATDGGVMILRGARN